jgi:hypothetical protein
VTRTLLAAIFLASVALAQDPPRPRQTHVEVPDPLAEEEPAPAPAATEAPPTDPAAPAPAPAHGAGGPPRRDQRVANGEAPKALSGKYTVVQLTEGGETEDFRMKMDRAGRAVHQDCITVSLVFDFGKPGGATLPGRIRLVERQECYKGGLGRYLNELTLDLPVAWSQADGAAILTVPEIRATAGLVRLRRPEGDGLGTAPQWLGPETKVDRAQTAYAVLAETARGRKGEIMALHMTAGHQVLHLEPQAEGGPFGD